jgi:F0F1-type ATP synthase membrane subunit b/b'
MSSVFAMVVMGAMAYLLPQEASADVDRLLRQADDAREDVNREKKDAKEDVKREKKDAKGDLKHEKKDAKGDVKRDLRH